MYYNTDTSLNDKTLTIIVAVIWGIFLFFVLFLNFYLPFKDERDYIKMEMSRSCSEKEYLFWKRKLKMLYIDRIPIVRSIVRRKRKR